MEATAQLVSLFRDDSTSCNVDRLRSRESPREINNVIANKCLVSKDVCSVHENKEEENKICIVHISMTYPREFLSLLIKLRPAKIKTTVTVN